MTAILPETRAPEPACRVIEGGTGRCNDLMAMKYHHVGRRLLHNFVELAGVSV